MRLRDLLALRDRRAADAAGGSAWDRVRARTAAFRADDGAAAAADPARLDRRRRPGAAGAAGGPGDIERKLAILMQRRPAGSRLRAMA